MKKYPLEIENVGDDVYCLMSKGFHDPAEFLAAAEREHPGWPMGKPEHVWKRTIPDASGEHDYLYINAEPNSRGAFPSTWSVEDYSVSPAEPSAPIEGREEKRGH